MNTDLLMQGRPWDESMRRAYAEHQSRWSQTALARRDLVGAEAARWVVARRFIETPLVRQCEREQLRRDVIRGPREEHMAW